MIRRNPQDDDIIWPKGISCADLESNRVIYCPELKHFVTPPTACHNCEIGFNGNCDQLNLQIRFSPKILLEIYQPYPELSWVGSKVDRFIYKGNLLPIDGKERLDFRRKIYFIKDEYEFTLRFIPKYLKINSLLSEEVFFSKEKGLISFKDLTRELSSGDKVYTTKQDENLEKILKLNRGNHGRV